MDERSIRILGYETIIDKLEALAPSIISKELARQIQPSSDPRQVLQWLDETEEAYVCCMRETEVPIGGTRDIRRIVKKARKEIVLTQEECMDVWNSIRQYGRMKRFFEKRALDYLILRDIAADVEDFPKLEDAFMRIFDDKQQIKDNATTALAKLRSQIGQLERHIKRQMQGYLQNKDIQKFFQESIVTVRNNRYVIPIKQEYRQAFPGIIHDKSSSGATLYIEPMETVRLNNDLQEARIGEKNEVQRIFKQLTLQVGKEYSALWKSLWQAGRMECIFAKAWLAIQQKAVRPDYTKETVVQLYDARHPLIDPQRVVPNTILLGGAYRTLLITGSNTGGKTVALKTLGLLTLMYQSGLFVTAAENSCMPVFRGVFADIGDEQDISQNLSTFSSHMSHIVQILRQTGKGDLVILDEIGSGTDPSEGSALAVAILKALHRSGALVMVTTHYNALKNYAYETAEVENGHVEFDTESLRPTYKLHIGIAGSSHAFSISRQLGLDEQILQEAQEIQKGKENVNLENILKKLHEQSRRLEEEQELAAAQRKEIEQLRQELQRDKTQLRQKKDEILAQSREEALELKRRLRIESEQLIKALKKQFEEKDEQNRSRQIQKIRQSVREIDIPEIKQGQRTAVNVSQLSAGQLVFVNKLGDTGTITEIKGNKISVLIKGMTVRVKPDELSIPTKDEVKKEKKDAKKEGRTFSLRTQTVATEINVTGKTGDEAVFLLEKFLDQALLAGFSPVKIIHGKGSGALRTKIHDYLKQQRFVKSFSLGSAQEGGAGVTYVFF